MQQRKSQPGARDGKTKTQTKAQPKRPLRLLVVEDHADTRKGLEMLMRMLGHEARFAMDFASALAAGTEEEFDALVSDINLPGGSGWELMGELDKMGRRPTLAIAISGFSTEQDLARSEAAGFHVHLVKPFAPEKLEAALQRAEEKPARQGRIARQRK